MKDKPTKTTDVSIFNDAVVKELTAATKTLQYGHILITIHNSRIVQIDKTEKFRFDASAYYDKGGGI